MKNLIAAAAATWFFTAGAVLAQDATLHAPAKATIGSTIEVGWTGPGNQYDSIYVIAPDAADDASGIHSAKIISGKNPVPLVMPDEPGSYELRYWDRAAKAVIARRPIATVDVETTLDAPDRAQAGARIAVGWKGPGNSYEQIGLFPVDATPGAKAVASATVLGRSPVQLHLPEAPGEYELRYLTRQSKRVLATRRITIEGVEAGIEAPATAAPGATIEIQWTGPGNQYDQLALFVAGANDATKAVRSAAIVSQRNPVTMRLPEEPGTYEIRYVTRQDRIVLARRPLEIASIDAELTAPDRATAATAIDVAWSGPGNDYDRIELVEAGASDDAKPLAKAAILNRTNPVLLRLPDGSGRHEIRYVTAQSAKILARRELTVEPAGRLVVVREGERTVEGTSGTGAVELILDASGSMLKRENGVRRIETARRVLGDLVRDHLSEDRAFALRVFGHKEADSCRTDLEIPLGPLVRDAAAARIASIDAMNLAKTPIADSLAKVPSDLAGATGPKTVVLITDGEETCDGRPATVIRDLRARGLDVQISIVGFAIDDAELRADFETWAELGGGGYFDARNADELAQSLRTVISGPFRVLDREGNVAGEGIVGGAEIVLPAGTYRIEAVGGDDGVVDDVRIEPNQLTRVSL